MVPETKKIYIVVKTYPTISREYSELVCTAGILEDGSWIRLYPVPFRKLDMDKKYPKYSWIQVQATRNTQDFRPETYRPDLSTLRTEREPKSNKTNWEQRKKIIFKSQKVYTNLKELIDKAKKDKTSLAIFKPTKILDFKVEPTNRDWDSNKLEILRGLSQQLNFFQTVEEIENEFKVVHKVPYKFSYVFEDDNAKQSKMMIEDWEIGMLYFHCLENANMNEEIATAKVKQKYFDSFIKSDLYFFLGTTLQHHNVSKNPFIIIGVFHPPKPSLEQQMSLFDKL